MIRLNTLDFDESLVFSGQGSKKNNYLINLFLKLEDEEHFVYESSKLTPEKFLVKLDSIKNEKYESLNLFKEKYKPTEYFTNVAKTGIDYSYYRDKEIYPYRYFGIKTPLPIDSLPNGYFDFRKDIDYNQEELKEFYPYLPLEEEGRLNDAWLKENFLMQIFAYRDLHELLKKEDIEFNDLVEFHTSYKYLIYAKSQEFYKELGHIVANHEKKPLEEILAEYKQSFLKAISEKSTINKTFNVLLHIFGYFKKHISKEEKELLLVSMDEYKDGIIPLITIVKMFKIYISRYDIEYLKKQKFLNPYPAELALRSDLKANK